MLGGMSTAAFAVPSTPLVLGNTLTFGGITATIGTCNLNNGPPGAPCVPGDNLVLEAGTSSFNSVSFIIANPTTGAIFDYPAGDRHIHDLGVAITFAATSPNVSITGAGLGIAGSSSTADEVLVAAGEGLTPGGSLNVNLSSPNQSITFAPTNSLLASKDINDGTSFLSSGPANLVLNTVTESFAIAVPEPASMTLLAAGIGAIGLQRVRARRGRAKQQPTPASA